MTNITPPNPVLAPVDPLAHTEQKDGQWQPATRRAWAVAYTQNRDHGGFAGPFPVMLSPGQSVTGQLGLAYSEECIYHVLDLTRETFLNFLKWQRTECDRQALNAAYDQEF